MWHFDSRESRSRGQRWIGTIVSALYTYGMDWENGKGNGHGRADSDGATDWKDGQRRAYMVAKGAVFDYSRSGSAPFGHVDKRAKGGKKEGKRRDGMVP